MRICTTLLVALLSGVGMQAADLNIAPRFQQTYVWCWVAVGEMVFDHYDVPNVNPSGNYQCGIIGLLAAGSWREDCAYRCLNCTVPAGSALGVVRMLEDYPQRVAMVGDEEVARLTTSYVRSALTRVDVEKEIDSGRPIVVGISPSGRPAPWASSQHVALVVGYDDDADGALLLLVNDPYPFGSPNPYVGAGAKSNGDGSYWIRSDAFRRELNWRETILVRRTGTLRPTPKGNACCFNGPYGPDACPLNLSGALPLGSACTCTYPGAWFRGQVCRR